MNILTGNLESYMKNYAAVHSKAKKLIYGIETALTYMHNLWLAHLNVKPGNLFVR